MSDWVSDSAVGIVAGEVTNLTRTGADTGSQSPAAAQRSFNIAMVVSGIRCIIAYVLIPFFAPLLGLARGVGPVLGLGISAVAIAANVASILRFQRSRHRLRRPITVVHLLVIAFLVVLMAIDIAALA